MNLKPETLRILVFAGIADVVIGAGLAIATLNGFFGPGLELFAAAGVAVAVWGLVLFVWGRSKLSQVEDRRGDLN
ncbi:hypothetical protein N0B44_19615 [Roseibacterium beibuensis]|uniref:hypothetical protein n=1 Tax=[Roseibacterium] beibuensis TaxID=1193142 RepID=UPI00217CCFD8|nr:hypothetical protein [Roseibacterium beibuensis]MCS6625125.1 hypothetical protein [Roseibacterium beibuensis]